MGLRDRFDIAPLLAANGEVAGMQQPFGGRAELSVNYPIVAVRLDNYTNRWLLFDSERFIVPPFTHGFVINLHTQQASAVFKSLRNPFRTALYGSAIAQDPNVKIISNPFPVGILVSLYDDQQPQLAPQSLVRIDNALVEAVISNPNDPNVGPITYGIGAASRYPIVGSLALPVVSHDLYYLKDARGAHVVGSRGPSDTEGADFAVAVAPAWTLFPAAVQPFASSGVNFTRLLSLLVSTDVAGIVQIRNQFGVNVQLFTARMAANTPLHYRWSPPGYWVDLSANSLQAQHSIGGNVSVTVELGAE